MRINLFKLLLISEKTYQELLKENEYLKKLVEIRSNEDLRVGPCKRNELFGLDGTFKKLNLD